MFKFKLKIQDDNILSNRKRQTSRSRGFAPIIAERKFSSNNQYNALENSRSILFIENISEKDKRAIPEPILTPLAKSWGKYKFSPKAIYITSQNSVFYIHAKIKAIY